MYKSVSILTLISVFASECAWQSHSVIPDEKYRYNRHLTSPLRFKTVTSNYQPFQTWVTFYYNDGKSWGQLRWKESNWGVELYGCTDDKLYTTRAGDKFSDVPQSAEKVWELSWNETFFSVDCNGRGVWKFRFSDKLREFGEERCSLMYSEKLGILTKFRFNKIGTHGELLNVPKLFFTRSHVGL